MIRTICTNAGVPSCIRVPPLTGAASSGSPSRVARSTAGDQPVGGGAADGAGEERRTRRPPRPPAARAQALAGDTDSSSPLSRPRRPARRRTPRRSPAAHGRDVPATVQDPSSSTRSMSSGAESRSVTVAGYCPSVASSRSRRGHKWPWTRRVAAPTLRPGGRLGTRRGFEHGGTRHGASRRHAYPQVGPLDHDRGRNGDSVARGPARATGPGRSVRPQRGVGAGLRRADLRPAGRCHRHPPRRGRHGARHGGHRRCGRCRLHRPGRRRLLPECRRSRVRGGVLRGQPRPRGRLPADGDRRLQRQRVHDLGRRAAGLGHADRSGWNAAGVRRRHGLPVRRGLRVLGLDDIDLDRRGRALQHRWPRRRRLPARVLRHRVRRGVLRRPARRRVG